MNPEVFQDPQKFLWPLVQAREAQQQLEDKLIEVEENFAMQQAILGWIIDNPWIFALFLQREVRRLDTPINGVAKKEIERITEENTRLKTLLVQIWEQFRSQICEFDVGVVRSGDNDENIEIQPGSKGIIFGNLIIADSGQGDLKRNLVNHIKNIFVEAGIDSTLLEYCPEIIVD